MTNFAVVLPSLIRMANEGHPVLIASHGRTKPNIWDLGSPFDVLVAAGEIEAEELVDRWRSDQEEDTTFLLSLIDRFPMMFSLTSMPSAEWVRALAPSSQSGKHAVLYVPDLQVDLPLTDWQSRDAEDSMSDYELMPAQLAGLKAIARQADAAVVGGHCTPAEDEAGWHVVAGIVDEAVVMEASTPGRLGDRFRDAQLDFYTRHLPLGDGPIRSEKTEVDLRFDAWRQIDLERRKS